MSECFVFAACDRDDHRKCWTQFVAIWRQMFGPYSHPLKPSGERKIDDTVR